MEKEARAHWLVAFIAYLHRFDRHAAHAEQFGFVAIAATVSFGVHHAEYFVNVYLVVTGAWHVFANFGNAAE